MLLEVISPGELLFKGNVTHVVFPGLDGSFGVLSQHAAMVSALVKGEIKVEQVIEDNNEEDYNGRLNSEFKNEAVFTFDINGGVVEVKDNKIIVLAE